jgi:RNA polymerase sigma-70 factor (ECF subfamily)
VNDRQGDSRDLRAELVAFVPRLRRFAHALTRSRADADDLVQATLERALTRLDQWQAGTRLDSWLYRIAQNLWIDQARAAKSRGEPVSTDEIHDLAGEDGRRTTESQLVLEDTWRAVAALPEEQRVVLALVSIEGLSYAEAAQALGIPAGTVMSRLARARATLAGLVWGHERMQGQES